MGGLVLSLKRKCAAMRIKGHAYVKKNEPAVARLWTAGKLAHIVQDWGSGHYRSMKCAVKQRQYNNLLSWVNMTERNGLARPLLDQRV